MSVSGKVAKKLKAVYLTQKVNRQRARHNKILSRAASTPGGIPWYNSPGAIKALPPLERVQRLASNAKQKGKKVVSTLQTKGRKVLSSLKPPPRVIGRKVQIVEWDEKRAPPLQRQRLTPQTFR